MPPLLQRPWSVSYTHLDVYKRQKEAHDEMDDFILLCFGDLLGIPIPTTYYSLELLPLIAEDLDGWQNRMISRLYIWQEKWSDYGFDA